MVDGWEIAILQTIRELGGEASLQQIYEIIPQFKNLTEARQRETRWERRPAYQHTIRSYVSNLSESGELRKKARGQYCLTEEGKQRLISSSSRRSLSQIHSRSETANLEPALPVLQEPDSLVRSLPQESAPQIVPELDSIDPEERIRILREQYRILRDPALIRKIKILYHYQCQICGETIRLHDGKLYAEVHHIKPLGSPHNGPDVIENMLCVCPNHHVQLDYGVIKLNITDLKASVQHQIGDQYLRYHNTVICRKG